MSSVSSFFGMLPAYHNGGGTIRPEQFQIASGYATTLYQGAPLSLSSTGFVVGNTASAVPIIGAFDGCEYVDVNGQPHVANRWPASQATMTGSLIIAWGFRDPQIIYEIMGNGPISQSGVGQQANIVGVQSGNATTGMSTAALDTGTMTNSATGVLRIIRISDAVDNAAADAYTKVYVQIATHQDYATAVAY